ncbi:ATP-dependent zinc protease [Bernardetia sp.]|uniref:ATP-dependent zinc protease family protein n=1 Tax=Bernardetia sp. TaxID=1937974 RepID=UPI0025C1DBC8|nr:RimK/LysX family protein [Bernardetia sp.]
MEIIGRVEEVGLTDLGVPSIDAKTDTGAYTSSLHCHNIRIEEEDGKQLLCFSILDPTHESYQDKEYRLEEFSQKKVRSSNGITQTRYKIRTPIRIGRSDYKTDFTLTNRGNMRYPILLGRKLLSGRFLVDCAHKYLLPLPKMKK